MSDFVAARLQMALTLGTHITFACFGIGLPLLLIFAEWRFLRTSDELWRTLAKRWSKAFGVLFAVGAVSGTVLSFELGLLWPAFMGTFGAVIGLPFILEGFAFFTEAIFVGIYLYAWDRLPPRVHWMTAFPIALSGLAGGTFVVAANSWMNVPGGFEFAEGRVVDTEPMTALFNAGMPAQATHMIVAALMVTGFMVAAFYAYEMLRGHKHEYNRRGLTLGLSMGIFAALIQGPVGHEVGHMVAKYQPIKLAAMEGQFETTTWAPLRIGGIPDMESRKTTMAVEIPGGLSIIAYNDPRAEVKGLNDFPSEDLPPVPVVHFAFQAMVGIGTMLMGLAVWTLWHVWKKRPIGDNRLLLWAIVAAGPLSIVALEAGWVVTEVGRQPWIVHGVMRTSEAMTESPGVVFLFCVTMIIYAVLVVGTIVTLKILSRIPLPEQSNDT
ncbi:MAG: cytochrome ubiquinol oxidase subunit I [Planctomycetota bacterium]|nr:cytochrome ubiquinol oxidase subunit I [Planctomycetota bacterium]